MPIDRTERQKEALSKWIKAKGRAGICACTGFGKTRMACMAIRTLRTKFPELSALVIVPTTALKKQWLAVLEKEQLAINCDVQVINSAAKKVQSTDLLIIDEAHRALSDKNVLIFKNCTYKYILCLSATMERLDGRHALFDKIAPVCDVITKDEAIANGWLSECVEYKVILDVENIEEYKTITQSFQASFEYFNYDFALAMKCVGAEGLKTKLALRDAKIRANPKLNPKDVLKTINYHALNLTKTMQARKKFINEHPDKIRLTNEIIKHRADRKIITFSATIEMAERLDGGFVYSGKTKKKEGNKLLEEFQAAETGVIHTAKKLDEGFDCKGLSVGIILGQDSSTTRVLQRSGRVIRLEEGKKAEIFTFVINDTVETSWYAKAHPNDQAILIDESRLMKVLNNEEITPYHRKEQLTTFRF